MLYDENYPNRRYSCVWRKEKGFKMLILKFIKTIFGLADFFFGLADFLMLPARWTGNIFELSERLLLTSLK